MAQTKESTKSKIPREKNTIKEGKKETKESFRINSPFGWRVDTMTGWWALHHGVDIAGKRGSPVLAPANGQVCKTSQQANLGNLLEIDHGNGYVSSYGHLDRFNVIAGDWVQEGQLMLALEVRGGAQARTYYELRYWGKLVHPAMYTMDILKTKGQLDPPLLIGCDMDTADRRPKIVF